MNPIEWLIAASAFGILHDNKLWWQSHQDVMKAALAVVVQTGVWIR